MIPAACYFHSHKIADGSFELTVSAKELSNSYLDGHGEIKIYYEINWENGQMLCSFCHKRSDVVFLQFFRSDVVYP